MPHPDDRARPQGRSGRGPDRPTGVRTRRWTAVLVAVAVAAVLAPAGWLVSRPAEDAGLPLTEALAPAEALAAGGSPAASPADPRAVAPASPVDPAAGPADASQPAPAGTPAAEPRAAVPGDVTVRDASLASLPGPGPAPTRLQVPSLGVDAAVDAVGVQADGAMVVPAEVDRVGWYRFGPEAGAGEGNAVLAGHVDTVSQGPGALFELRGVEIGAELVVTDAAGADHRYQVVSRETVTKTLLPVEQIFARTGAHRLVVITCGGEYLPGSRRYADNVVVTAVPVVAP